MSDFDENKHPRASDGKFTDGNGGDDGNDGNGGYSDGVNERIKWAKENGIDLPLNEDGSVDDLKLQELYDSAKQKTDSKIDEKDEENNSDDSLEELLGEEFKGVKGQEAIDKLVLEKKGHVKGAFHREDIGDIDLLWGSDSFGLRHIIKQREDQGINSQEFLKDLSETVEKGEYYGRTNRGDFEFLHNGKMAVIAIEYHGNKITYLLTAFKTRKKAPPKDDA